MDYIAKGKNYNEKLLNKTPQEIIDWAISEFPIGLFQTTAFGATGMASMDMLKGKAPLIFIDTLYRNGYYLNRRFS
jgi:3'-phosphoadenosine 5'-phosphosulfate sulfotransferase (PAPS reductase)/FAD synthetase